MMNNKIKDTVKNFCLKHQKYMKLGVYSPFFILGFYSFDIARVFDQLVTIFGWVFILVLLNVTFINLIKDEFPYIKKVFSCVCDAIFLAITGNLTATLFAMTVESFF